MGRSLNESHNQPLTRTATATIYPYPAFGTMTYYGLQCKLHLPGRNNHLPPTIQPGFYRASYNYGKSIDDVLLS